MIAGFQILGVYSMGTSIWESTGLGLPILAQVTHLLDWGVTVWGLAWPGLASWLGLAWLGLACLGLARKSQAEPSQAKPSQARPSQAKPRPSQVHKKSPSLEALVKNDFA